MTCRLPDRFLTVDEAAEVVRVTPYTVREWLREGRLRGHKVHGGRWLIDPRDLAATEWEAPRHTRGPMPNAGVMTRLAHDIAGRGRP